MCLTCIIFGMQVMASRREAEQSKSKEAVEEVHWQFVAELLMLNAQDFCPSFGFWASYVDSDGGVWNVSFSWRRRTTVYFWHLQVETREEQNKKWEETRNGRVDSWRNWTNGKRKGCVWKQFSTFWFSLLWALPPERAPHSSRQWSYIH